MVNRIEGIAETGFTVVHQPEDDSASAVVDIVIVHGLQGHPFTTWASPKPDPKSKKKSSVRARVLGRIRKSTSVASTDISIENGPHIVPSNPSFVFWPRDLLPHNCPRSRILVYGYDSKVTKYMKAPTNKNTVFSHAKDLLFALSRERELDRPLILVAHSLGGIVVKEMLAQSSMATENDLNNIVESVSSVIFLGTPHRGSPGLAAVGEWARSLVGNALRMETNDAILNALNLKTTDLERAQESFSSIWFKHDFRVKTFQEGLGLTGVNLSVLGNKVVPDHSSVIGDARERAETIQANHMEMCRFTGAEDPNYAKLSGEIVAVYKSLVNLNNQDVHRRGHIQRREPYNIPSPSLQPKTDKPEASAETAALKSLWYPSINKRQHNLRLEKPAPHTCRWLFEQDEYQEWFLNSNQETKCGLILLKGKPGAGKSTLLHEAFLRAQAEKGGEDQIAAFFFNAKGSELEHSTQGLFRSLLHQLLPHHPSHLRQLVDMLSAKEENPVIGEEKPTLTEGELRELLLSLLSEDFGGRTYIFIDALDECDADNIRPLAYFWRDVTKSTPHLSVCISSRHYPSVTVANCPEIMVDKRNNQDIATYVDQRLSLSIADDQPEKEIIKTRILEKAAGVFLWVTLVVDDLLRKRDEGKALNSLLRELDDIPSELEALYCSILGTVEPRRYTETLRLFQWAILATRPLRLYEWDHILGFMTEPPMSLRGWRIRKGRMDSRKVNVEEIERQIRTLSKGLVEVKTPDTEDIHCGSSGGSSVDAGAGSLESGYGENLVIHVIHESVREFFLKGGGFGVLGGHSAQSFIADGHISIMRTCLDYIDVEELDGLVKARTNPDVVPPPRKLNQLWSFIPRPSRSSDSDSDSYLTQTEDDDRHGSQSVHSFGSAYSHTHNRQRATSIGGQVRVRIDRNPTDANTAPPKEYSVFDALKKSSDEAWSREYFSQRMMLYNINADDISINPSAAPQSAAGETRLLTDYPALLSYAVFQLFTHAQLAQESGADPKAIVNRLRAWDNRLWIRWLALLEDLSLSTGLVYYAASQGLNSWIVALDTCVRNITRIVNNSARRLPTWTVKMEGSTPDVNHTDQPQLLKPSTHPVAEVISKPFFCECESCALIFNAMLEAIKRRNTLVLDRLSRYSRIGTLYRDAKQNTILHILARLANASLLRTYLSSPIISNTDSNELSVAWSLELQMAKECSQKNKEGQIPLHIAAARGNIEAVLELLQSSQDYTGVEDCQHRTPLHLACSKREKGTSTTAHDISGNSVLIASLLLERGATVNAIDGEGHTALHCACLSIPEPELPEEPDTSSPLAAHREGELRSQLMSTTDDKDHDERPNIVKMIDLLLRHGADVNSRSNVGATPLHIACRSGDTWRDSCPNTLTIVKRLLDAGADPCAITGKDETALHIAAARSSREVAGELIRRGTPIMARDCLQQTALHHAAWAGNNPVAEEILAAVSAGGELEMDINTLVDHQGSTPLHFACQFYDQKGDADSRKRSLGLMRNLVERGAQVHEPKNWLGLSPFEIAQQRGHYDVVALLREFGGDPPSEKGWALLRRFAKIVSG